MFTKEMELAYRMLQILPFKSEGEIRGMHVEEIAQRLSTTTIFISKIRQRLKTAGLVESIGHKGVVRTRGEVKVADLYLVMNPNADMNVLDEKVFNEYLMDLTV